MFMLSMSNIILSRDIPEYKKARLDSIRTAIKAKGADWQADTNAIFLMDGQDFELMLGEIGEPQVDTSVIKPIAPSNLRRTMDEELPDSFDWRNHDDRNWMTSVKNQGSCGSCWAFASIGMWEPSINIAVDSAEYDLNLSEQQLVSCARSYWDCDGGSWTGSYFMNNGVADESCYPYIAANGDCDDLCDDWRDRVEYRSTLSQYVTGSGDNIDQLKALVLEHPCYITMDVYQDFNSYSGGIYEHSWGSYRGGHGIVLIGYNDADSCWICKNSWGGGWGESGYFRIKYYDSDIARFSYRVRVAPKISINSVLARTMPDTGEIFENIDSTVYFSANSPVIGNGDTIFRPSGAIVDGFRGDSTIDIDTFSLKVDGPIEITWKWDTITGIPKVPLHIRSEHQDAAVSASYHQMQFDTMVNWMAESTVTIATDTHQTLLTDSLRQIAISWENWSDGGDLSHEITLPSIGEDSIRAKFNVDTVRFWMVIESETSASMLLNGEEIYPTYTSFIDSGNTQELIAQDYSGGAEWQVFSHWEPYSEDDTLEFTIEKPETLKAFFDKKMRTWFSNDFGDGLIKLNGENHDAAEIAAHDSGATITMNVCDDQIFLGHKYIFETWSDSIAIEHEINLDSARYLPPKYTAYYDEYSFLKIFTEFGATDIETLSAPVDSEVTISVLEDTLYDGLERRICTGWQNNWIRYDTVFFEGFFSSSAGGIGSETHPPEWIEDSIWNDWMTGSETVPFCFPQCGDAMMTINLSHSDPGDTSWLVSDTFAVPSDADSIRLWFWMLEAYHPNSQDSLWLQVSSDEGASWNLEGSYTNHGPKFDWVKRIIDLEDYAGEEILLRFKGFAGGWSQYRIIYDNIFVWAAYTEIDSGTGAAASFTPEWNCSLHFNWQDEYFIELVSEHDEPTGEGWHMPDSEAVILAADSIEDEGWLYTFREWNGLVASAANPCTFEVSEPGTIWANYDTSVMARVYPQYDCAEIIIGEADTSLIYEDWIAIGDSLFVSAVSPLICGTDTQAVFRTWSDSSDIAHFYKFDEPDSVIALYDYAFLCKLAKSPFTGVGWVAMDSDTFTDSLSNWYMQGESFHVAASDSDYHFASNTLWLFDGFSNGESDHHDVGPVEQPISIQAEYLAEDFFLDIAISSIADSIWFLTDTMEYGDSTSMTEVDGFEIQNNGNAPIDYGLHVISYGHELWRIDSIPGPCKLNVRGRFQSSLPVDFERHYDFIDTLENWADNQYLGPDGFAIEPGQEEKLWLYLYLPTYCGGYWSESRIHIIKFSLISRYWMP